MKKTIISLLILIGLMFANTAHAIPLLNYFEHILPKANNTYDLGTSTPSRAWKAVYSNNFYDVSISDGCAEWSSNLLTSTGSACGSGGGGGTDGNWVYNTLGFIRLATTTNNVAIGTTSPTSTNKLSVVGNGYFSGNIFGAGITATGTLDVSGKSTLSNASTTNVTVSNNLTLSALTASNIVGTDANKNLVSLTTGTYPSLTELSYVKGVTSAIQTQLNSKGTVSSVDVTVPTGLTISGNPITTTGTLAFDLDAGYVIPLQTTLDGFVPYTGATGNVDLGGNTLTAINVSVDEIKQVIGGATVIDTINSQLTTTNGAALDWATAGEVKLFETGGITNYVTLNANSITGNKTQTFPNLSGTFLLTDQSQNFILGNGTTTNATTTGSFALTYLNSTFVSADQSGRLVATTSPQPAGNYITALTGDGTASGPASATLTLATVNSNTGSFGSSTAIPSFTVNGKGLITAASTNAVVAPAGTLTGATLASGVTASSLTSLGTIAQLVFTNASGTNATISSNFYFPNGRINTSGYVGIGTTTPDYKLDVQATAGDNDLFKLASSSGSTIMSVQHQTGTSTMYISSDTAGFGGEIILEDTDGAGCTSIAALDGALVLKTTTCP